MNGPTQRVPHAFGPLPQLGAPKRPQHRTSFELIVGGLSDTTDDDQAALNWSSQSSKAQRASSAAVRGPRNSSPNAPSST